MSDYFYSYLHLGHAGISIDLYYLSTESGAHSCMYTPTEPQENWETQGANDGRLIGAGWALDEAAGAGSSLDSEEWRTYVQSKQSELQT